MKLGGARATQIAASIGQALAFVLGFLGLFGNPLLVFIAIFVYIAAAGEAPERFTAAYEAKFGKKPELFAAADEAMYQAKRAGKNRVSLADTQEGDDGQGPASYQ